MKRNLSKGFSGRFDLEKKIISGVLALLLPACPTVQAKKSLNGKAGTKSTSITLPSLAGWDAHTLSQLRPIIGSIDEAGTNVNVAVGNKKRTALMYAAAAGNTALVDSLMDKGADVRVQDTDGRTVLMFAVANGNAYIVNKLLERDSAAIDVQNADGYTALMEAVERENKVLVRRFLRAGTNMDLRNNRGKNAVDIAVNKGNKEIVQMLLEEYVKQNKFEKFEDLLFFAATKGDTSLVKGLQLLDEKIVNAKDRNGRTALMIAIGADHADVALQLLSGSHVNVNEFDKFGLTPLMLASQKDQVDVVNKLLEKKADVNATDKGGWNALMFAVRDRNVAVVRTLLDSGAKWLHEDKAGYDAIMVAAERGNVDVVLELMKKGACCDVGENNEALMEAVRKKDWSGAKGFLEGQRSARVGINMKDINGETPLMSALRDKRYEDVKTIMEKYPNWIEIVNAQNAQGKTALMFAVEAGYEDVVQILLKNGANVELQDENGLTALEIAIKNRNKGFVELLLKEYKERLSKTEIDLLRTAPQSLCRALLTLDYVKQTIKKDKNLQRELVESFSADRSEFVDDLLSGVVDLDSKYEHGQTLLIRAIKNEDNDLVEKILSRGVSIFDEDDYHKTALTHAFEISQKTGNKDILRLVWLTFLKYQSDNVFKDMNDLFLFSSAYGDINFVRTILEYPEVNVNAKDDNGQTALMHAAENGHINIVKLLLEDLHIDNLNQQNIEGETALMYAVGNGHLNIVKLLLKDPRINVNQTNDEKQTVLMKLVSLQDKEVKDESVRIEILKTLLSKGISVNQVDNKKSTALMYACSHKCVDMVQELLKQPDINVNAKDETGATALMHAVNARSVEIVKALLKKGADVNEKDNESRTILQAAVQNGDISIVQELLKCPNIKVSSKDITGNTAFLYAAKQGHLDIVRMLLEYADRKKINIVREVERYGATALFCASFEGHIDIVRELLTYADKHRIDIISAKTNAGETALMGAAKNGKADIVRVLLEYAKEKNIDIVSVYNHLGCTALHIAAGDGHVKVVEELIADERVNVDAGDIHGETALICAVCKNQLPIVNALLDSGRVDMEKETNVGATALVYAAQRGNVEIVKALLERGANVNVKDPRGQTLTAIASNQEIKKLLKDAIKNSESRKNKIY